MATISFLETTRPAINTVPELAGRVIYCTDTGDTFYDMEAGLRVQVTSILYYETDADRIASTGLTSKLYMVKETSKLYKYTTEWVEVTSAAEVDARVGQITELIPGTYMKDGKAYAFRTLLSCVYDDTGQTLLQILDQKVSKDRNKPLVEGDLLTVDNKGSIVSSGKTTADVSKSVVEIWGVGPSLLSNRAEHVAVGIATSTLITTGKSSSTSATNTTDILNEDNVWYTSTNTNIDRAGACGVGSVTNTLIAGGYDDADNILQSTESYANKVWTTGPNLVSTRKYGSMIGSYSNPLVLGGIETGTAAIAKTEKLSGASWLSDALLLTIRTYGASVGSAINDSMIFGGSDGATNLISNIEKFNGTVWSTGPNMNIPRERLSGNGIVNSAYAIGGINPPTNAVVNELFDGTKWASGSAPVVNVFHHGATGTTSNTILTGGYTGYEGSNPSSIVNTVYNDSLEKEIGKKMNKVSTGQTDQILVVTYDGGAAISDKSINDFASKDLEVWTTGPNLIYSVHSAASTGKPLSIMVAGGKSDATAKNTCQIKVATTWSTSAAVLPAAIYGAMALGTSENCVIFGGYDSAGTTVNTTYYKYDGIGFTVDSAAALTKGSAYGAACGTITDGFLTGGADVPGVPFADSFKSNGTVWATAPNLLSARSNHGIVGSYSGALIAGGVSTDSIVSNDIEKFNGTTWSKGATLNTGRRSHLTMTGEYSAANISTGMNEDGILYENTEYFDGLTVKMGPSIASSRINAGAVGSSSEALIFGGLVNTNSISTSEVYKSVINIVDNKITVPEKNADPGTILVMGDNYNSTNSTDVKITDLASAYAIITSVGPTMLIPRSGFGSSTGSSADIFIAGGISGANTYAAASASCDGTTWKTQPDIPTPRQRVSGTGSAANVMFVGGVNGDNIYANVTDFNGTAWYNKVAIPLAGTDIAVSGSYNDGLAIGRHLSTSNVVYNTVNKISGDVWSTTGALSENKAFMTAIGTTNNTIATGGSNRTIVFNTIEKFNGTTWFILPNTMNKMRHSHALFGTVDSFGVAGGMDAYESVIADNTTDLFDGEVWKTGPNLISSRKLTAGSGNSSSSGLVIGGTDSSAVILSSTERILKVKLEDSVILKNQNSTISSNEVLVLGEDGSLESTGKTIEDFAPAVTTISYAGPNLNIERQGHGGATLANRYYVVGGQNKDSTATNTLIEFYKETEAGPIWQNSTATYDAASVDTRGSSLEAANVIVGISSGSTKIITSTNTDDPTITVEEGPTPLQTVSYGLLSGTSYNDEGNIDILHTGSTSNNYETFILSGPAANRVWSVGPSTIINRVNNSTCGSSSTKALIAGGTINISSKEPIPHTERLAGVTWSIGPEMSIARYNASGCGIVLGSLVMGGKIHDEDPIGEVERFDGTVWRTCQNLLISRSNHGANGPSSGSMVTGGSTANDNIHGTNSTEYYGTQDISKGIRVVDNLETEEADSALSANQGVEIKTQLDQKVDYIVIGNTDIGTGGEASFDFSTFGGHPPEWYATAAEVEELKNSVSDGKTLVAGAVTEKGVNTAADATFQQIHDNIIDIPTGSSITIEDAVSILAGKTLGGVEGTATSDADATVTDILPGKTAYVNGIKLTGTATSDGDAISTDILPGRIAYVNGVKIIGIATNEATALATDIMPGKTAYVKGNILTGTATSDADATITDILPGKTAYVNGVKLTGTATSDATAAATDILGGKTAYVNGVLLTGTATNDADALVADILVNKTAYVKGSKLTGTMPNNGNVTQTLTSNNQSYTIPRGYHTGNGTVRTSISNLSAGNIRSGVNVGGVTGTFSGTTSTVYYAQVHKFSRSNDGSEITFDETLSFSPKVVICIAGIYVSEVWVSGYGYLRGYGTLSGNTISVNGTKVSYTGIGGNFYCIG